MKKILIVMPSLTSGGAEKSLISFLQIFERKEYKNRYKIDLLLFQRKGLFLEYIPSNINVIQVPLEMELLYGPFNKIMALKYLKKFRIYKVLAARIYSKIRNKSDVYWLWKVYSKVLKKLKSNYDIAIAYQQTHPIYYIVDKVSANLKIGWMHNNFKGSKLNVENEEEYLNKLDILYSVSSDVYNELNTLFSSKERRFELRKFENIISPNQIVEMSNDITEPIFTSNKFKFLTIGRLEYQKGYALMLKAFKKLKEKGIDFELFIIGEGSLKNEIEDYIENNALGKNIKLFGITENPYPLIKQCDAYIQTSRYEGFGIAIAEARILRKPLLLTNFNCAHLHLGSSENGLIVDSDEESIVDGAIKMINNIEEYKNNCIRDNYSFDFEEQISSFINTIEAVK